MKLPQLFKPKTSSKSNIPKSQLSGGLARIRSTWRLFWQQKRQFMLITAVVAVPTTMLRSYQSLTVDFSLVYFLASLYVVLALIYACRHIAELNQTSLAALYTKGSGRFLQLLGVTMLQSLVLLPIIFATTLLVLATSFDLSHWLYIPLSVFLVIALLGLVRVVLAQFITSCEDANVISSLRQSWQRTHGNGLRILAQYTLFVGLIAIVSSAIFFIINLSSALITNWLVQGVVSSVLIVVAMPWFIIFGYSIYDETR